LETKWGVSAAAPVALQPLVLLWWWRCAAAVEKDQSSMSSLWIGGANKINAIRKSAAVVPGLGPQKPRTCGKRASPLSKVLPRKKRRDQEEMEAAGAKVEIK